jgi:hypothetical protein
MAKVAAALTDCLMGNQGHLPRAWQSGSLSLHNARKIQRTELLLAKANTAIVKCRCDVSFSDAWSGLSFRQNL